MYTIQTWGLNPDTSPKSQQKEQSPDIPTTNTLHAELPFWCHHSAAPLILTVKQREKQTDLKYDGEGVKKSPTLYQNK